MKFFKAVTMTFEFVLACVLVASPGPVSETGGMIGRHHLNALVKVLEPSLVVLGVREEIFDVREMVSSDLLETLQSRFAAYAGEPMLGELNRFPCREFLNDSMAANRVYRLNLDARKQVDLLNACVIDIAVSEARYLHQVYDTLRDAGCSHYYVTIRRQSLGIVRSMIGYEAFYSGNLPPHLPVWRISLGGQ